MLQKGHFRNHIEPTLGFRHLAAITTLHVESLVRKLREQGAKPPTIHAVLRLLKRLLNAAVASGRIGRNPAKSVAPPRLESRPLHVLTRAEVDRLVAEIPDRWKAFVLVLAWSGLRIGEAAAITVDRIDWERRRIRIDDQLTEVVGVLRRAETKTRRKRSVTLPRFVMAALAAHVERYKPLRTSDPVTNGLVFYGDGRGGSNTRADKQGGRPTSGAIRRTLFADRVFAPAVERAGLPPMRVHDLRHSAAALAIQAGAHPKAIQERLGHTSIRTTFDVYGHLFDGLDEDLADKLDELYERPDELRERRERRSVER